MSVVSSLGVLGTSLGALVNGFFSGIRSGANASVPALKSAGMIGGETDSLVAFTQPARLDFGCLVDNDLLLNESTAHVIQTAHSLVTSYYLQALNIDTTVGEVKILQKLNKFNPNRELFDLSRQMMYSQESYLISLPFMRNTSKVSLESKGGGGYDPIKDPYNWNYNNKNYSKTKDYFKEKLKTSKEIDYEVQNELDIKNHQAEYDKKYRTKIEDAELNYDVKEATRDYSYKQKVNDEAEKRRLAEDKDYSDNRVYNEFDDAMKKAEVENKIKKDENYKKYMKENAIADVNNKKFIEHYENQFQTKKVSAKDSTDMVKSVQNLAVGRLIEVVISDKGQSLKVNVSVRINPLAIPSQALSETLALGHSIGDNTSRFRAWKAGELSFWRDLVFSVDKIDNYRKTLAKDTSGFFKATYDRVNKNKASGFLNGDGMTIGNSSSIIIMSEKTKRRFEKETGRDFDIPSTRAVIFNVTYAMLIFIVDEDYGTVTLWTRGIELPTHLTLKSLKSSSSKEPDLLEIMKTFMGGKVPNRI